MAETHALPEGRVDWESLRVTTPHDGVLSRRLDSEALTIIRYDLEAGARYPFHMHELEHFIQGVSGRATITLGDDTLEVAPADLLRVPAGLMHRVAAGETGATLLNIGPRRS